MMLVGAAMETMEGSRDDEEGNIAVMINTTMNATVDVVGVAPRNKGQVKESTSAECTPGHRNSALPQGTNSNRKA